MPKEKKKQDKPETEETPVNRRNFKIKRGKKTFQVAVEEGTPEEGSTFVPLTVYINDKPYEVEVESEGTEAVRTFTPPAAKKEVSAPKAAPKALPSAKPTGAGVLTAPMAGKILQVHVSEGDKVNAGETLVVLEAMKMENELRAPKKGTIASISVKVGDAVNTNEEILTIE